MDSSFVRCCEEDECQRRLAGLLPNVPRLPEVPTLVATGLSVLSDDLERPYFLTRRAYWARDLHFESCVRERQ